MHKHSRKHHKALYRHDGHDLHRLTLHGLYVVFFRFGFCLDLVLHLGFQFGVKLLFTLFVFVHYGLLPHIRVCPGLVSREFLEFQVLVSFKHRPDAPLMGKDDERSFLQIHNAL